MSLVGWNAAHDRILFVMWGDEAGKNDAHRLLNAIDRDGTVESFEGYTISDTVRTFNFESVPTLTANPASIKADGTEKSLVTYRAPGVASGTVVFDVNGMRTSVNLDDAKAEIEITPSGPGPIVVSVDIYSIQIEAV